MFALGELQAQPQAPAGNLPNAPSSSKTEPSLQELGFPPDQTQANPKEQALLDKRTHMLKIHQRMGLITTVPLLATLVTSVGSGGKRTSNTDRNVHMVLGAVRGICTSSPRITLFVRPECPKPKLEALSVSTRPWRGFMARV